MNPVFGFKLNRGQIINLNLKTGLKQQKLIKKSNVSLLNARYTFFIVIEKTEFIYIDRSLTDYTILIKIVKARDSPQLFILK